MKSQKIKSKIIMILMLLFFAFFIYEGFLKPNQLLKQVVVDLNTTKQALGEPSPYYFVKSDCDKLQFITCQEMNNQSIEVIYFWTKGLDMNVVVGFDKADKLKFKKIVINEQLSIKE